MAVIMVNITEGKRNIARRMKIYLQWMDGCKYDFWVKTHQLNGNCSLHRCCHDPYDDVRAKLRGGFWIVGGWCQHLLKLGSWRRIFVPLRIFRQVRFFVKHLKFEKENTWLKSFRQNEWNICRNFWPFFFLTKSSLLKWLEIKSVAKNNNQSKLWK